VPAHCVHRVQSHKDASLALVVWISSRKSPPLAHGPTSPSQVSDLSGVPRFSQESAWTNVSMDKSDMDAVLPNAPGACTGCMKPLVGGHRYVDAHLNPICHQCKFAETNMGGASVAPASAAPDCNFAETNIGGASVAAASAAPDNIGGAPTSQPSDLSWTPASAKQAVEHFSDPNTQRDFLRAHDQNVSGRAGARRYRSALEYLSKHGDAHRHHYQYKLRSFIEPCSRGEKSLWDSMMFTSSESDGDSEDSGLAKYEDRRRQRRDRPLGGVHKPSGAANTPAQRPSTIPRRAEDADFLDALEALSVARKKSVVACQACSKDLGDTQDKTTCHTCQMPVHKHGGGCDKVIQLFPWCPDVGDVVCGTTCHQEWFNKAFESDSGDAQSDDFLTAQRPNANGTQAQPAKKVARTADLGNHGKGNSSGGKQRQDGGRDPGSGRKCHLVTMASNSVLVGVDGSLSLDDREGSAAQGGPCHGPPKPPPRRSAEKATQPAKKMPDHLKQYESLVDLMAKLDFRAEPHAQDVTVDHEDMGFSGSMTDAAQEGPRAAVREIAKPGLVFANMYCCVHIKLHLDKHKARLSDPKHMYDNFINDLFTALASCPQPRTAPTLLRLLVSKWSGGEGSEHNEPAFVGIFQEYLHKIGGLPPPCFANLWYDGGQANHNMSLERTHRVAHSDQGTMSLGGAQPVLMQGQNIGVRSRLQGRDVFMRNLHRDVWCATFWKQVHSAMALTFNHGTPHEATISCMDAAIKVTDFQLDVYDKSKARLAGRHDPPTFWNPEADVTTVRTTAWLVPTPLTVTEACQLAWRQLGHGVMKTSADVRNALKNDCADGTPSWVKIARAVLEHPEQAQEENQYSFDDYRRWCIAFALLIPVLCAWCSSRGRVQQ